MFDWLYELLGTMLSWFSSIFGGYYAFALLIYALLFKVVFLPFSIKQQKNQIKMAKLAPQIELIKAKYAGRTDQPTVQKMQQEIMDFQQKEGYSPLSGCLPMLLQFPIIIFLYNVIRNPLSYICKLGEDAVVSIYRLVNDVAAETEVAFASIDQIKLVSSIEKFGDNAAVEALGLDFSTLPNFNFLGLNLAETPNQVWGFLILVPVIAAVLTWLSMWLTRKWNGNAMQMQGQDAQAQASNKIMDLVMPGMTLFFCFSFSGMMGVYWIYQSALGILQTYILSKAMPLPKFTEEELKAMKRAQKNTEKNQRQTLKEMPRYRSLHYIDEDDYDELPEVRNSNKETKKTHGIEMPEIKD